MSGKALPSVLLHKSEVTYRDTDLYKNYIKAKLDVVYCKRKMYSPVLHFQ